MAVVRSDEDPVVARIALNIDLASLRSVDPDEIVTASSRDTSQSGTHRKNTNTVVAGTAIDRYHLTLICLNVDIIMASITVGNHKI